MSILRLISTVIICPLALVACQKTQSATGIYPNTKLAQPVKMANPLTVLVAKNEATSKASGNGPVTTRKNEVVAEAIIEPEKKLTPEQKLAQSRKKYAPIIAKHAKANGVPVELAMAVIQVESNYRPGARGKAGEIGLMQLLPRTARYIGYEGDMQHLYHPDTNIQFGMQYLGKAHKLGGGSTCRTILKYNAGHGAKRMNKTSRHYCSRVRQIMQQT